MEKLCAIITLFLFLTNIESLPQTKWSRPIRNSPSPLIRDRRQFSFGEWVPLYQQRPFADPLDVSFRGDSIGLTPPKPPVTRQIHGEGNFFSQDESSILSVPPPPPSAIPRHPVTNPNGNFPFPSDFSQQINNPIPTQQIFPQQQVQFLPQQILHNQLLVQNNQQGLSGVNSQNNVFGQDFNKQQLNNGKVVKFSSEFKNQKIPENIVLEQNKRPAQSQPFFNKPTPFSLPQQQQQQQFNVQLQQKPPFNIQQQQSSFKIADSILTPPPAPTNVTQDVVIPGLGKEEIQLLYVPVETLRQRGNFQQQQLLTQQNIQFNSRPSPSPFLPSTFHPTEPTTTKVPKGHFVTHNEVGQGQTLSTPNVTPSQPFSTAVTPSSLLFQQLPFQQTPQPFVSATPATPTAQTFVTPSSASQKFSPFTPQTTTSHLVTIPNNLQFSQSDFGFSSTPNTIINEELLSGQFGNGKSQFSGFKDNTFPQQQQKQKTLQQTLLNQQNNGISQQESSTFQDQQREFELQNQITNQQFNQQEQQRLLQQKNEKELQEQKRQREYEAQQLLEQQRQKELEEQRLLEQQRQKAIEEQKQRELEQQRQKAFEEQKQRELEQQRFLQQQRQKELEEQQKLKELEEQRLLQQQRQKELEEQRLKQLQKQKELEEQRFLQQQRQKELEQQRYLQQLKEKELESQRRLQLQKQKELEEKRRIQALQQKEGEQRLLHIQQQQQQQRDFEKQRFLQQQQQEQEQRLLLEKQKQENFRKQQQIPFYEQQPKQQVTQQGNRHTLPANDQLLPQLEKESEPESNPLVPHQPPLSVFYRGQNALEPKITDVLKELRSSNRITVLDQYFEKMPKVFVGPAGLTPPAGYGKFELPYLSNLETNRIERKIDRLPFFVAPLNFVPPPGYAKIPFPAPHVGSVVVSSETNPAMKLQGSEAVSANVGDENESGSFPMVGPELPGLINGLESGTTTVKPITYPSTPSLPQTTAQLRNRRPNTNLYKTQTRKPITRSRLQTTTTKPEEEVTQPIQKVEVTKEPENGFRKPFNRFLNRRRQQSKTTTEAPNRIQLDGKPVENRQYSVEVYHQQKNINQQPQQPQQFQQPFKLFGFLDQKQNVQSEAGFNDRSTPAVFEASPTPGFIEVRSSTESVHGQDFSDYADSLQSFEDGPLPTGSAKTITQELYRPNTIQITEQKKYEQPTQETSPNTEKVEYSSFEDQETLRQTGKSEIHPTASFISSTSQKEEISKKETDGVRPTAQVKFEQQENSKENIDKYYATEHPKVQTAYTPGGVTNPTHEPTRGFFGPNEQYSSAFDEISKHHHFPIPTEPAKKQEQQFPEPHSTPVVSSQTPYFQNQHSQELYSSGEVKPTQQAEYEYGKLLPTGTSVEQQFIGVSKNENGEYHSDVSPTVVNPTAPGISQEQSSTGISINAGSQELNEKTKEERRPSFISFHNIQNTQETPTTGSPSYYPSSTYSTQDYAEVSETYKNSNDYKPTDEIYASITPQPNVETSEHPSTPGLKLVSHDAVQINDETPTTEGHDDNFTSTHRLKIPNPSIVRVRTRGRGKSRGQINFASSQSTTHAPIIRSRYENKTIENLEQEVNTKTNGFRDYQPVKTSKYNHNRGLKKPVRTTTTTEATTQEYEQKVNIYTIRPQRRPSNPSTVSTKRIRRPTTPVSTIETATESFGISTARPYNQQNDNSELSPSGFSNDVYYERTSFTPVRQKFRKNFGSGSRSGSGSTSGSVPDLESDSKPASGFEYGFRSGSRFGSGSASGSVSGFESGSRSTVGSASGSRTGTRFGSGSVSGSISGLESDSESVPGSVSDFESDSGSVSGSVSRFESDSGSVSGSGFGSVSGSVPVIGSGSAEHKSDVVPVYSTTAFPPTSYQPQASSEISSEEVLVAKDYTPTIGLEQEHSGLYPEWNPSESGFDVSGIILTTSKSTSIEAEDEVEEPKKVQDSKKAFDPDLEKKSGRRRIRVRVHKRPHENFETAESQNLRTVANVLVPPTSTYKPNDENNYQQLAKNSDFSFGGSKSYGARSREYFRKRLNLTQSDNQDKESTLSAFTPEIDTEEKHTRTKVLGYVRKIPHKNNEESHPSPSSENSEDESGKVFRTKHRGYVRKVIKHKAGSKAVNTEPTQKAENEETEEREGNNENLNHGGRFNGTRHRTIVRYVKKNKVKAHDAEIHNEPTSENVQKVTEEFQNSVQTSEKQQANVFETSSQSTLGLQTEVVNKQLDSVPESVVESERNLAEETDTKKPDSFKLNEEEIKSSDENEVKATTQGLVQTTQEPETEQNYFKSEEATNKKQIKSEVAVEFESAGTQPTQQHQEEGAGRVTENSFGSSSVKESQEPEIQTTQTAETVQSTSTQEESDGEIGSKSSDSGFKKESSETQSSQISSTQESATQGHIFRNSFFSSRLQNSPKQQGLETQTPQTSSNQESGIGQIFRNFFSSKNQGSDNQNPQTSTTSEAGLVSTQKPKFYQNLRPAFQRPAYTGFQRTKDITTEHVQEIQEKRDGPLRPKYGKTSSYSSTEAEVKRANDFQTEQQVKNKNLHTLEVRKYLRTKSREGAFSSFSKNRYYTSEKTKTFSTSTEEESSVKESEETTTPFEEIITTKKTETTIPDFKFETTQFAGSTVITEGNVETTKLDEEVHTTEKASSSSEESEEEVSTEETETTKTATEATTEIKTNLPNFESSETSTESRKVEETTTQRVLETQPDLYRFSKTSFSFDEAEKFTGTQNRAHVRNITADIIENTASFSAPGLDKKIISTEDESSQTTEVISESTNLVKTEGVVTEQNAVETTTTDYQEPVATEAVVSVEPVSKPKVAKLIKTSTTTKISHETEICYKGKCIRTKAENPEEDLKLLVDSASSQNDHLNT